MLRFFRGLFRSRPEKHLIDRGRVFCPRRSGDVDADLCAGCRWVVEVREDGAPPYVTCQPGPEPLPAPGRKPRAGQSE